MSDVETPEFEAAADRAAKAERDIQAPLDAEEERSFKDEGEEKEKPAMQAGARLYPAPPFPEQHQVKPGIEARPDPAPMYDAPFYKGSGKLKGKVRADHRRPTAASAARWPCCSPAKAPTWPSPIWTRRRTPT